MLSQQRINSCFFLIVSAHLFLIRLPFRTVGPRPAVKVWRVSYRDGPSIQRDAKNRAVMPREKPGKSMAVV